VAWYGAYELRLAGDRGVAGTDPVVNAATSVQRELSALVGTAGGGWLLAALAGLVAVAVVARLSATARPSVPSGPFPSGLPPGSGPACGS
jgi:hypothetical protein